MGSRFAPLPTETLQNLLQEDCNPHDREALTLEEVLEIMEILELRAQSPDSIPRRTADQALADLLALAESDTMAEPPVSADTHSKSSKALPRKLAWLVAVVALLATCTVAATAFQFDFLAKIASWTSETFQFVSEFIGFAPEVVENDALAEFRAGVDVSFETALTPTWCPEGYEVTDITHSALTTKQISAAVLSDGEREIIFTVTYYQDGITGSDSISEKLDGDVATVEYGGITHYLIDNNATNTTMWQTGDFECLLCGAVSMDTLEQMIESIY